MRFATVASALLSLVSVAVAQNQTISVNVGGSNGDPEFIFSPNNLNATEGSIITFMFTGVPGNHTITQSTFAAPCQTMSGGFDSGFVLIPSEPSITPTFNLTITNGSVPIWFHCKQLAPSPHCNAGMVGAINAPTSGANTFQNFVTAASQSQGLPGQDEGGLVGVGASASTGPGPFTDSDTGLGVPTGASAPAAASGTSSASASASASAAASGAVEMMKVSMTGLVVALGVVVGSVLA